MKKRKVDFISILDKDNSDSYKKMVFINYINVFVLNILSY